MTGINEINKIARAVTEPAARAEAAAGQARRQALTGMTDAEILAHDAARRAAEQQAELDARPGLEGSMVGQGVNIVERPMSVTAAAAAVLDTTTGIERRIDAEHERTTKGFEAMVERIRQQEERIIGLEQLAADAMESIAFFDQRIVEIAGTLVNLIADVDTLENGAAIPDAEVLADQLERYREQIEVEAARVGARVSRIVKLTKAMKDEPT